MITLNIGKSGDSEESGSKSAAQLSPCRIRISPADRRILRQGTHLAAASLWECHLDVLDLFSFDAIFGP
jgi:hypothetical protein